MSHFAPGSLYSPVDILSRSAAEEYSTTASMAFADATSATVSQKVVAFTAKLSIPVIQMPTGWLYRGQPIKAGAGMVFDTPTYVIRGTILSMTFVDAASSRRSTTP